MKTRSIKDVETHKESALQELHTYLDTLLVTDDNCISKADKLSYWIKAWVNYLNKETDFDSRKLRRYKRGEIIKVNLGFNIGSEEGGLHYAVVIDNENALSDPTIRIVPLTSIKPDKDISSLPKGNVFLGNELFTSLSAKISSSKRRINEQIEDLQNIIAHGVAIETNEFKEKIQKLKAELNLLNRMNSEISKMKIGSIALVQQITTVSKLRIHDPKTNHDILSNIKLSNEKLDLIDNCIISLYTKKR